jgi:hypothetical protein
MPKRSAAAAPAPLAPTAEARAARVAVATTALQVQDATSISSRARHDRSVQAKCVRALKDKLSLTELEIAKVKTNKHGTTLVDAVYDEILRLEGSGSKVTPSWMQEKMKEYGFGQGVAELLPVAQGDLHEPLARAIKFCGTTNPAERKVVMLKEVLATCGRLNRASLRHLYAGSVEQTLINRAMSASMLMVVLKYLKRHTGGILIITANKW